MMVWCVDTRESDWDSPSLVVMRSVSYYSPFLAFVEKVRGLPLVHRCWKLEMPLADTATPAGVYVQKGHWCVSRWLCAWLTGPHAPSTSKQV